MERIDDWWIHEHGFVDNPLWEQLDAAIAKAVAYPNTGEFAGRSQRGEQIRRRLLPRSKWHVYYTYDATRELLPILAVWYGGRGRGPPL